MDCSFHFSVGLNIFKFLKIAGKIPKEKKLNVFKSHAIKCTVNSFFPTSYFCLFGDIYSRSANNSGNNSSRI